jgi:enoyl-CoA hydratase
MEVKTEKSDKICTIIINRPEVRNAVNGITATKLADAFRAFEEDDSLHVAVLWGKGGYFCAGADLKAIAENLHDMNRLNTDMSKDGPMGPTRMSLSKPVIAAVAGYAVAGGLELACWCDLRVAEQSARFGVFCRRFGVPLIDGGTQRLPRMIGMSRALDMIITGREVTAQEAHAMGLVNYLVDDGKARDEAERLAREIAELPQKCLRSDREALYRGFDLDFQEALKLEFNLGLGVIQSGETLEGAQRFSGGEGRHGKR